MYFIAEELREIMAQLGFRTLKEMVGQSQKLRYQQPSKHYKASGLGCRLFYNKPEKSKCCSNHNTTTQDHSENVLDFDVPKRPFLLL
jgi:glutamate synthase (ferredoxin)